MNIVNEYTSGTQNKYRKKYMIILSHSNYLIRSSGTEKFIKDVVGILGNNGIGVVQCFPLVNLNKKIDKLKNKVTLKLKQNDISFFGINIDGRFEGVCNEEYLSDYLHYLAQKHKIEYYAIQLQHLSGWNLNQVEQLILVFHLPVLLFIHDYYMICQYIAIVDGGLHRACNRKAFIPSREQCGDCVYSDKSIQTFIDINQFLQNIYDYVDRVIVPSKYALKQWLGCYDIYAEKAFVRPHLHYDLRNNNKNVDEKVKIAFLGYHGVLKGYKEWKTFVSMLSCKDYEFYNFSKQKSDIPCVHDVAVDINNKNLPRMVDALRENGINICFLWCVCGETYSYTTFEAWEAGCFIITNDFSGNIVNTVEKNNCGKIFETLDACINWFSDIERVKKEIGKYYAEGLIPFHVEANKELQLLVPKMENLQNDTGIDNKNVSVKDPSSHLLSFIYKMARSS